MTSAAASRGKGVPETRRAQWEGITIRELRAVSPAAQADLSGRLPRPGNDPWAWLEATVLGDRAAAAPIDARGGDPRRAAARYARLAGTLAFQRRSAARASPPRTGTVRLTPA